MDYLLSTVKYLEKGIIPEENENLTVYKDSLTSYKGVKLLMVKSMDEKLILTVGEGDLFNDINGSLIQNNAKNCPLTHENRLVLNKYFRYTIPKAFGRNVSTIGLGDRIGLASPGHIKTIINKEIKPILAQQSIRELTLTNRTMQDVLDSASFAAFQEGYKGGFGADADHLKHETDIEKALKMGFSMITLDCSDYIDNSIKSLSDQEIKRRFNNLPAELIEEYKGRYENQTFNVSGLNIIYDELSLMKNVLIYGKALHFTCHVFETYIKKSKQLVDFELSIDETETVTSPLSHFFVASELNRKNVEVTSLAPKFYGEFQKGIDYIGDISQFEKEFKSHELIASHFGYKLSIHSGSDKFKVFPIISKYTKGIFHVKTAGTNWLEAIRVISKHYPSLYRRMHKFALENFHQALKYYHITPDLSSIEPLENVSDEQLPLYMDKDASRQLFHVTYGLILSAKENDTYLFKDEFYSTIIENEKAYNKSLISHIGKHLESFGL